MPNPWIALSPLVVVGVMNFVLTKLIPRSYGAVHEFTLGAHGKPIVTQISSVAAIWAVEGALLLGILTVFAFAWRPVLAKFADGSKAAVAGSLLASLNTASEYGFGGVIALLPGFVVDRRRAQGDPQSSHQRGGQRHRSRRHHRVRVRRHEHCSRGDVRHVHCRRRGGKNSA